ncbi:MFS transporter [Streptomyces sp. ISL-43]|uniref:MFS transporter n=1 Tax=Streptomyces sp. ISL-43 TaxID=2819183 RepID=UPI0027E44F56|nr:MFS transporter [Streptomyces sp. ISL-43]
MPEALVDLVRACLHKDPARRPTPQQVADRTATDQAAEWLPGAVLAQLGRHAAQLLDYAPATPAEPQAARPDDPRVLPAQRTPLPPPPQYAPAAPAHFDPARGFGPPPGPPPGAWPANPYAAPSAAPLQDSASGHAKRWRGLVVAALVQLLVVLEATVFNTSISSVQEHFDISAQGMGLILTAYVVAFAVLLLPGGHLADLLGRRLTLIIGLVGFAVACALGGSNDGGTLVWARGLQGAFGALLTPAALSLVATGFTGPRERGRAFGVYAALTGGGWALGLLAAGPLGGLSWRLAAYAPVLVAAIALIGVITLPRDRPGPAGARPDVLGLLLGSGALGSLAYGLAEGGWSGWSVPLVPIALVAGAILLAAFLWWQTRTAGPLLAPYVVKDRNRLGGLLATLLAGVGTVVLFSSLSHYLLNVIGYVPAMAGVLLLPMAAAIAVGSTQVSARLAHRAAPGVLIAAGLALAAGGLVILTGLESNAAYVPRVLPGTLITGLGLGMALMPIYATVTAGVAPRHAGGASAAILAAQQLGEGIGGMLLGVAISARLDDVTSHQEVVVRILSGYTTALWWAFGAVLLAGLAAGLMVNARAPLGEVRQAAELPR